ncbi:MAG: NAD(P)-dependent oxidoreductase [Alphaproteobacteria bacterium]|nr:NAD(P)-dependent oxidoreductase [Alphaproteobacteria bacterium]
MPPQRRGVAVIGLGIMGGEIARNLAAAGFAVTGFDIDPVPIAAAAAAGVAGSGSAAEAAHGKAVALTSLPSAAALEATVSALVAEPPPGLIVAELSTLPIAAKQAAHDRLRAAGLVMLDCPLSGTGAQAATRDLAVFASGDEAACRSCEEVFAGFARVWDYLGPFGNGSRMKFVANLLVAVHNVASAEAIVLGTKAGLDAATILRVIGSSAANSRIFELRGPMMAERRYVPATMKINIWQKDMSIIGEFARGLGVDTPTFSATAPLYAEALASGFGAEDVGAVHAVLERRAGVEPAQ